ncbi:MAG: hypothetical protein ABFE13_01095 [Phycisphaerales bacterium]
MFRIVVGVLIGAFILVGFIPLRPGHPRKYASRVVCLANLHALGTALEVFAGEHGGVYPPSDKWCDSLVGRYVHEAGLRCRKGDGDRCDYAMNPLADRWSATGVVLLFESEGGWNQAGGPELLTTERHEDKGCSVLFVDGRVEFVRTEEIPNLKWEGRLYDKQEEMVPPVPNARRPEKPEEMEYWLKNMIWYHQFKTPIVRAAMGLKTEAIYRAQEICGVYRAGRPVRADDATLLIVPYPGGRHPRIGFLEGAVDPQRETKFSVFTPWDPNSYVVVDAPEAIWSNLGLTYLAHTHIDTIWTKQGIELPKLEWNRREDGSLDIERKLPNGIAFGVKVVPGRDAVRMEMWLENGTEEKLTDLRVQNCVMPKMAAGFAAQTNDNKVFTDPYVACRSEDGAHWIVTAWEGCDRPWGNEDCPCFHSDPKFPDLEPGQRARLRGWLSFYVGRDIEAEFKRIEATGWRAVSGLESEVSSD